VKKFLILALYSVHLCAMEVTNPQLSVQSFEMIPSPADLFAVIKDFEQSLTKNQRTAHKELNAIYKQINQGTTLETVVVSHKTLLTWLLLHGADLNCVRNIIGFVNNKREYVNAHVPGYPEWTPLIAALSARKNVKCVDKQNSIVNGINLSPEARIRLLVKQLMGNGAHANNGYEKRYCCQIRKNSLIFPVDYAFKNHGDDRDLILMLLDAMDEKNRSLVSNRIHID